MGIFGSLVGIGGQIVGGIAGARSAQKQRQMIENQQRNNEDWYSRRYNEDATQRADAQALLTATEESIRRRNRAAAGTQAVMGGTDESVAAAKEANNQALSNTMSNINAQAVADKQNVERQYLNTKSDLNNQLLGLEQLKQQQIKQATEKIGESASKLF